MLYTHRQWPEFSQAYARITEQIHSKAGPLTHPSLPCFQMDDGVHVAKHVSAADSSCFWLSQTQEVLSFLLDSSLHFLP